ncbi:hypothetical protein E1630_22960 [Salmonella enterica subsp. enterica serovar Baguida]|nr:hypothetical protein [Salmonella enterica subsp. enterica serovar Baguida]
MTDQEFLELKTEVERLEALHKASRDDHNMDIDERRAIADAYTLKDRELTDEGLRRVTIYKDTD